MTIVVTPKRGVKCLIGHFSNAKCELCLSRIQEMVFPFFRFTQKSSNDFFQEYFLSFSQIEKGKVVQTQSYSQSLPHAQIREMEDGSFDFIFTNIVGKGGKNIQSILYL